MEPPLSVAGGAVTLAIAAEPDAVLGCDATAAEPGAVTCTATAEPGEMYEGTPTAAGLFVLLLGTAGLPLLGRFFFLPDFLLGTAALLRRIDCDPKRGLRIPPGFRGRPSENIEER